MVRKGGVATHLPTIAGKAVMIQLVALVAAANKGAVGVEAALLARGTHVTLVHIWWVGKTETINPQGQRRPTPVGSPTYSTLQIARGWGRCIMGLKAVC